MRHWKFPVLSTVLLALLAVGCSSAPRASATAADLEARCRSYALGNSAAASPPRLVAGRQPAPPSNARSGYVCVRATVTESGTVIDPVVVQTDNREFADALVRSLADWRYEPATLGSAKVVYHTTLFARFPQQH
jgi:hypothetical protein